MYGVSSALFQKTANGIFHNESMKLLGLKISNELIRKVGGQIKVKSEEGKGSIFFFTIPLKENNKKD